MREQFRDGRIPGDSVPQLSSMVLVDCSVDLFAQLTLEGLVDQLYRIENGVWVSVHAYVCTLMQFLCVAHVWLFPAETFSDEVKKSLGNLYNEQRGEGKIRLSGKDDLYTRLRDLHIQEIGPFVRRELAELQDYTFTPHCSHPHSSLLPPSLLQPSLLPSSSLTAPTLTPHSHPHSSHPHSSLLHPHQDISYTYSGYAPLSVRLVEMLSMSNRVLENAEVLTHTHTCTHTHMFG